MDIWSIDKLIIFILFVVPGFISLKTYELLCPNQRKDSSKQIVDAIAYSCFNYSLWFFLIIKIELSSFKTNHQNWYLSFYFFVIFVSPVIIVLLWKKLRSTEFFQKRVPHPTEKPWDYFFAQRKPYWVKIVLKNGTIIGGRYSYKSFTSSAPAPEQIYLEETWIINEKGNFERAKNNTAGVIILSNEISHIEFRN